MRSNETEPPDRLLLSEVPADPAVRRLLTSIRFCGRRTPVTLIITNVCTKVNPRFFSGTGVCLFIAFLHRIKKTHTYMSNEIYDNRQDNNPKCVVIIVSRHNIH